MSFTPISAIQAASQSVTASPGIGEVPVRVKVHHEVTPAASQAREFAQAMEVARGKQSSPDQAAVAHARAHPDSGLGGQVVSKVQSLSESLRAEQKKISNMVEQATQSGDSHLIVKAQLALGDHQSRVQIITRVTSKAASSMDQLTRLQ